MNYFLNERCSNCKPQIPIFLCSNRIANKKKGRIIKLHILMMLHSLAEEQSFVNDLSYADSDLRGRIREICASNQS